MHDGMGKYFEQFHEVNREYLAYLVNNTAWECVILNRNNNMYDDPFYDEPFYEEKVGKNRRIKSHRDQFV